jgi:hypothetical protein
MRAMISTLSVAFGLALAIPALADEAKKDADDAAKDAEKKEMSVQQPPAKSGEIIETTGKREDSEEDGKAIKAGEKTQR